MLFYQMAQMLTFIFQIFTILLPLQKFCNTESMTECPRPSSGEIADPAFGRMLVHSRKHCIFAWPLWALSLCYL